MANHNPESERLRVWAFGYINSVSEFEEVFMAEKIYEKGGDQYVIVRADEVEIFNFNGEDINIIVPMDVRDDDGLNEAKSMIEELGVEIKATIKSLTKIPNPPHMSHGFITSREIEWEMELTGKPSIEYPGRQHASPGSNKWG